MSNDAYCSSIGKSSLQTVFVEIESTKGTLQRPTSAGFILPAGQVTMTQTPTFSDSDELSASLNVTDQFKNAIPPAEISIPMLARMSATTAPQGNALFTALMGVAQPNSTVTAALVAGIDADDVSFDIDTVAGGDLPPVGVISIGSEKVLYLKAAPHGSVAGQWTLSGCTRGYASTTAATATANAVVTLFSRVWMQDVCRPSVSVWLKSDHTVFFAEGATVTAATVPLSDSGGQHVDFSLQAKRMGWCGTSTVSAVTDSVVTLEGRGAYAYSKGAILQNKTKNDSNSNAGYTVTAVDTAAGRITLSPAPTGWGEDDVLVPWLPVGTGLGEAQAASAVRVLMEDATGIPVADELQSGSLNIGTPTSFATPIGTEYPIESADTKRDITIDCGLYFRKADVEKIGLGYKGNESAVVLTVGDTAGKKLAYALPRVKFSTPEPSSDGEFMTLTQKGKALGVSSLRDRESALYLVQI
ncbi:MAG: hypothetical protein PHN64_03795 [Desulfovibrionaceae bacterium]|nr:hypothetical protein [Desulfovibrionaceae bacterium]